MCDGSVADVAALLESYRPAGATIAGGHAVLELGGGVDPGVGVTPMAPRRVHPARVRDARWLPAARVTVEVDSWSRERFLDATGALVDALVSELSLARIAAVSGRAEGTSRLPRAS